MSATSMSGRPWRRLQAQVFAEEDHCCLCNEWVDQGLPQNHEKARSVHHVISPVDRPDLALKRSNCHLACRDCNRKAGQGAPVTAGPVDNQSQWLRAALGGGGGAG